MDNIETLKILQEKIENKESSIYFLVYDTKDNARAAIKNIYDMALALHLDGYIAKILVEDKKNYTGVESWLGETYKDLPVYSIKEDKVEIFANDIIVIPEYYSNVLQQLANVKGIKVMLVQQKEYIFETLSIGSKWRDFGIEKAITTTEPTKKYIKEYFPETLIHLIPPYIGDNFKPTENTQKPIIAISCRDRNQQRKIISEFYLKYPQLRWITFKDMVQMSYDDFAESLKECMVSLWIDDESTLGTFPLESMKCGVPVIGKIPNNMPDWMGNNGMWTDDINKLVEILATFVFSWLEGVEITDEVKDKMNETVLPFTKELHTQNTLSVFKSLFSGRVEAIKNIIENKEKEVVSISSTDSNGSTEDQKTEEI